MSRGRALLDSLGGDFALPEDALHLRLDEPMARHTTLGLGGPADLWLRPADEATLSSLLTRLHEQAIPITFVGSGTNLLVRDGGIRGAVIKPRTDESSLAALPRVSAWLRGSRGGFFHRPTPPAGDTVGARWTRVSGRGPRQRRWRTGHERRNLPR